MGWRLSGRVHFWCLAERVVRVCVCLCVGCLRVCAFVVVRFAALCALRCLCTVSRAVLRVSLCF